MREFHEVVLSVKGIPLEEADDLVRDIEAEFHGHRRWHLRPRAAVQGEMILFRAINTYDPEGLATLDELEDTVIAYSSPHDVELDVVSTRKLGFLESLAYRMMPLGR